MRKAGAACAGLILWEYTVGMMRPCLVVFASGTKDGGGSGFENLVRSPELDADIAAVVSNHERGGVRERAERLGVPFIHFDPSKQSNILTNVGLSYREVVESAGAEWVALSGWLGKVEGLDPQKTFNIHPALLSFQHGRFGGKGMHGRRIHEAVKVALDAGEVSESGFTMHFTTDEYDRGPIFYEHRVPLERGMTAEDIAKAVHAAEHVLQPRITNMVVHGEISWDGIDPATLVVG